MIKDRFSTFKGPRLIISDCQLNENLSFRGEGEAKQKLFLFISYVTDIPIFQNAVRNFEMAPKRGFCLRLSALLEINHLIKSQGLLPSSN